MHSPRNLSEPAAALTAGETTSLHSNLRPGVEQFFDWTPASVKAGKTREELPVKIAFFNAHESGSLETLASGTQSVFVAAAFHEGKCVSARLVQRRDGEYFLWNGFSPAVDFTVDPALRGKGVGKALTAEALEAILARGDAKEVSTTYINNARWMKTLRSLGAIIREVKPPPGRSAETARVLKLMQGLKMLSRKKYGCWSNARLKQASWRSFMLR